MDRAIERVHQAAAYDGQPWPPERKPERSMTDRMPRHPGAIRSRSSPGQKTAGTQTEPEPDASEPETLAPEATGPGFADDGRAARLESAKRAEPGLTR